MSQENAGIKRSNWKEDLRAVLDNWSQTSSNVILSADVDGLLSCALVAAQYPVHVAGVYTTTHLLLLDGATRMDAADALWLDHDVSEPGVKCIGQHLVHHASTDVLPLREPQSFNPNVWVRQDWKNSFSGRNGKKRDKFPFGTAHFLANAFDLDLGEEVSPLASLLAHADGTWRTVVDYRPNAEIWQDLMFKDDGFLVHLRDDWANSSTHLKSHADLVSGLIAIGVSNSPSRAKIASLLPMDLQMLTGRQSIRIDSRNVQDGIDRVKKVLDYVATQVGSKPTMSSKHTSTISGVVDTPYPDKISNFDDFMIENEIFSHAFTDLRTLRYTTGIKLRVKS
jgi:hypothetical protein